MNKKDLMKELKERFKRLYKDCTLYCVQLDGFSHALYYKDKDGQRHHEDYSGYDSSYKPAYPRETRDGKVIIYSWNEDRTKAFFLGYAHLYYSHGNCKELCFKDVSKW